MRRSGRKSAPALAVAAVAALGLGSAGLAASILAQIADPSGPVAGTGFPPYSPAYAAASNARLTAAWPTRDRAGLMAARAETQRELAVSPASGTGWLRLAVIEAALAGRYDAAAATALERSYAVAPLSPRLIEPRVAFAYNNWGELSPELRAQTLDQIDLAWRDFATREAVRRAAAQISDPGGLFAFSVKLAGLNLSARVDRQAARQPGADRPPS